MKKVFTLAALGLLTAGSFSAQAQAPIVVDGKLTATEIVASGYQLVGRDTGPQGFGDFGLISVYAAADANNIYFFVVGTLESKATEGIKNSIQMFIGRPGVAGVPIGTALPKPTDPATGPATSFQNMIAKLDLVTDLGVSIKGTGKDGEVQLGAVSYTATTATAAVVSGATPLNALTGAPFVVPTTTTGTFAPLAGASVSYVTNASLTANRTAGNGAAGSTGLEIKVSRSAMGIPATGALKIFVLQNNGEGGFLSSDYIPQNSADIPAALGYPLPNLGGPQNGTPNLVDFANIPGTQAATLNITASGLSVVTANRSAVATALKFGVFPNPSVGAATISYVVPGQQEVALDVFNSLGQRVRTLAAGKQAGANEYSLSGLASGAYFVKLQVGEQSTSQKLIVQ